MVKRLTLISSTGSSIGLLNRKTSFHVPVCIRSFIIVLLINEQYKVSVEIAYIEHTRSKNRKV
jgi:hypothetical protein